MNQLFLLMMIEENYTKISSQQVYTDSLQLKHNIYEIHTNLSLSLHKKIYILY